jgi:L-amino acid N-acyltransferase YncA
MFGWRNLMPILKLVPLDYDKALQINEFWERDWSAEYALPNQDSMIIDACAIAGEKVVGYGIVKTFAEAMLFIDKTARPRDRAIAVKSLMAEALRGAEKAGVKDIYCFIKDPAFASLIARRYGFKIVGDPGFLLVREV